MPVIITFVIAMFLILLSWTWHNLGNIPQNTKIGTIAISLVIIAFITFLIFNISKNGVQYDSEESMNSVRNVLVLVFTIINGLIIMPTFAKTLGRINNREIEKEQARSHFVFIFIVFIIALVIECSYLKGVQQGILDIYNNAIHK
ncbi:MAG: hypothetical protein J6N78_00485 [Clostridia bacterium]|nr:hypothetical protein [Clostridia bacterium]